MSIDELIKAEIRRAVKEAVRIEIEKIRADLHEPKTGTLKEIADHLGASYDAMRREAKQFRRWKQGRAFHYYVEDWKEWFQRELLD